MAPLKLPSYQCLAGTKATAPGALTTGVAGSGVLTIGVLGTRTLICGRSEEHTSELQSRRDLVCRLLLEKKKASELGNPDGAKLTTLLSERFQTALAVIAAAR